MEDFYLEETDTKNVLKKCLIILLMIGICIGSFLYYKKENTFKVRNIKIEVGNELSKEVEDYIIDGKFNEDYRLFLDNVDSTKVGTYTYKVKYNKHIETGQIKVIDTKKPIVETNEITIGTNEKLDLNILITSCKDDSLPCTVELKRESDINKIKKTGTYDLELKVSDAVGNTTIAIAKITSSETETLSSLQTNDLKYYTNSENDDTIGDILFVKLEKAIKEDTTEYEGLIHEISAMDFEEYETPEEITDIKLITAYNKYNYVIGIQVLATFNDGNTRLLTK